MDSCHRKLPPRLPRCDLLKAGLATSAILSAESVLGPRTGWAQQPKRGGTLRAWGYDPPHFNPHLILGAKTHNTLITGSWQSYVKNYAPNPSFDYGNRAAALWLDR